MSLNETDELVDIGVDITDIDSVIETCLWYFYVVIVLLVPTD